MTPMIPVHSSVVRLSRRPVPPVRGTSAILPALPPGHRHPATTAPIHATIETVARPVLKFR